MTKYIYLLLLQFAFNCITVNAQSSSIILPTKTTTGKILSVQKSCSYNTDLSNTNIVISLAGERETDIIEKILSFTGLPLNFQIFSARINNAAALVVGEQRVILYDPILLTDIDNNSKTYWTSISILAHEIGHHLSGHTLMSESNFSKRELEADKFSGFVLYKMGASLEQSVAAINLYGTVADTRTHPNKTKRLTAITSGWNEASGYRYSGAIPPPPSEEFPQEFDLYPPDFFVEENDLKNSEQYKNHRADFDDPTIYEGTIMEVDPRYKGTPNNKETDAFQVIIQRVFRKGANENFSIGDKIWITYTWPNIRHCSMVQFRWFDALVVPGRKIYFSAYWEGGNSVGHHVLHHIKARK